MASSKKPMILPQQIFKVSRYDQLPGQTYRSPDCKTFYWRENDHEKFTLMKRQCECTHHSMLLSLDLEHVWYDVPNEILPELIWVTEQKSVPAGIYRANNRVMARPESDQEFRQVEFEPFQAVENGCLVLGSGIPSKEVVARVDGKLYCIPFKLIPQGGN
jgi:hypothetical protein